MNISSIFKSIDKRITLIYLPRTACFLFIFLQMVGMLVYPGGTIHDASTLGYTFSQNFFSDMGAYAARNGEPNYLSMMLFSFSLMVVGITFMLYYLSLPSVLGRTRSNYMMACLGSLFATISSICMIGTGLTPTDLVFEPHVLFANNIFHFSLLSSSLYTVVVYRSEVLEMKYITGYVLFFFSIAAYVGVLQFGPSARASVDGLVFQVVSQKMIVLAFICSVLHQTYGFSKVGVLSRET